MNGREEGRGKREERTCGGMSPVEDVQFPPFEKGGSGGILGEGPP
jgi:hypothetical protein